MQTVLLDLLTVVVSVLLAVLGLRWVRRQVDLSFLEAHHEVAGFFISVIAVMYGVVMAFAVLAVCTRFA